MSDFQFNSIEEILAALAQGEMVLITDDEDRENEGDLIAVAEKATPDVINFMATYGRGLICVPITQAKAESLGLPLMVTPKDPFYTAFTISIDAATTTTGISAYERAETVKQMLDPHARRKDFNVPGHMFPLIAKEGGVLVRPGHTEATVDLARLAGFQPIGLCCEIMGDDGKMSRLPQLIEFAKEHHLKMATVKDLIAYRQKTEGLPNIQPASRNHTAVSAQRLRFEEKVPLPVEEGLFDLYMFTSILDGREHLALVYGEVENSEDVLVRIHSECLTGDVFGSKRCDCGDQLHLAMREVVKAGKGAIIYLRQEGRGIGLREKLHAYRLQDQGLDTVEANIKLGYPSDLRNYAIGADILKQLNIKSIRLMTNNPDKVAGLQAEGICVTQRVPVIIPPCSTNAHYLNVKKEKMGHQL